MDENRSNGNEMPPRGTDPNETFTFEELTPEEKRGVISALSRGKLSEDEKRQLARAVSRSRLSDAEKQQLNRAFALSRMTDEERRQLLAKRQQSKNTEPSGQAAHAAAVPGAPKLEEPVRQEPDADTKAVSAAQIQKQNLPQEDSPTMLQHTTAVPVGADHAVRDLTPQRAERRHRRREENTYDDADHTALTSLLKGIVYIVSVLVISVFASWTIIEIANDVFAFVKNDEVVSVVIEEDMTAADVAQLLADNGVIKYPTIYELYIRLKKENTNYLVGEYEISTAMNYDALNDTFTYVENTREQVILTIPEGYTTDQIIDLFLTAGIGTREGFEAAINDYEYTGYAFLDQLGELDDERMYRLDGYLFPDTYYFFKDSSEVAVIDKFLANFARKVTDEYYERAEQLGMTLDELITLASMIQAEGVSLTDFENISSVFHNRLDNAREYPLLQSDATLQYILDKRKVSLTAEDLKLNSKYNSYLYPGLPPGAVCNPGMDAIDCALYPADTDYYYFLADGKGNTYFSKTNEEHEALKKQYIDND